MQHSLQRAHARGAHRRLVAAFLGLALAIGAATTGLASIADAQPAIRTKAASAIRVSSAADRSASVALEAQQVTGKAYVFLPPPRYVKVSKVEWFLDDPAMQQAPRKVQTAKPYDFVGTTATGLAMPWDTSGVAAGSHRITARWTTSSGNRASTTAEFSVKSLTSPTTAPAPTTTAPAPTTTVPAPTTTTTAPAPPVTTPPPSDTFALNEAWFQANTGPRVAPSRTCDGNMTSANAGQTFSGCIFPNGINGNGIDNVTIVDSLVKGSIALGWESLNGSNGWKIHYTEIDGRALTGAESMAVSYDGFDLYRTEIYGHVNGIRFSGGQTKSNRIVESYLHDLKSRDPYIHRSCIGSNGHTGPLTTYIQRNWIECTGDTQGLSGALVMYGDFGQITNVTVEGNFIDGSGSWTVYGGSISGKPYPVASNVDFIGNRFGRVHQYGPVSGYSTNGGGTWSDNRYLDNGQLIG